MEMGTCHQLMPNHGFANSAYSFLIQVHGSIRSRVNSKKNVDARVLKSVMLK